MFSAVVTKEGAMCMFTVSAEFKAVRWLTRHRILSRIREEDHESYIEQK